MLATCCEGLLFNDLESTKEGNSRLVELSYAGGIAHILFGVPLETPVL